MDPSTRQKLRSAIEAIREGREPTAEALEPLFGRPPSREEATAARNRLATLRLASVEAAVEMVVGFVEALPRGASPLAAEERAVDELLRAAAGGRRLSLSTRHLFGVLSSRHEAVLTEAIRCGEIDRGQLLACAHDGRALTELLVARSEVRVPIAFRTTDFFGMPQVPRQRIDEEVGLVERVPVWTSGGPFALLVSNEFELRMANGEADTCAWLERTIEPTSVLWDVGANVGFFSIYAAKMHAGVRAVGFEPAPHNFARLHENVRINGLDGRIVAFPVACSDASGLGTFGMSFFDAGAWSQQGILAEEEVAEFKAHRGVVRIGCVTLRLDEFASGACWLPPPTHLKIDVDGPELRVLEGARGILTGAGLRHVMVELREDREAELAGVHLREAGFRRTYGPARGPGNRFFERG